MSLGVAVVSPTSPRTLTERIAVQGTFLTGWAASRGWTVRCTLPTSSTPPRPSGVWEEGTHATHARTRTHAHAHTHVTYDSRTHARMHPASQPPTHTHTHTHTRTHTRARRHTHTSHTHAHTHAHNRARAQSHTLFLSLARARVRRRGGAGRLPTWDGEASALQVDWVKVWNVRALSRARWWWIHTLGNARRCRSLAAATPTSSRPRGTRRGKRLPLRRLATPDFAVCLTQ